VDVATASLPVPTKTSFCSRVFGASPEGAEIVGFEPFEPPTSGRDADDDCDELVIGFTPPSVEQAVKRSIGAIKRVTFWNLCIGDLIKDFTND
jgi:hypothetical protein